MLLATWGFTWSCVEEGSTGGVRALATSSGSPQRDSPPAQGGTEILDKVDVVYVPVTMLHNFQQFFEFVFLKVPQVQFIVRVLDTVVIPQRQVCTVSNCAQDREDSTGAVLRLVVDAPVVVQRHRKLFGGAAVAVSRPSGQLPCCGAEAFPYGPVF